MDPVDRPPVRVQEEGLRPPVRPARQPTVTARRAPRAKTVETAQIGVTAVIARNVRLARR